ncbi:MAG: phosphotransferase family protein [Xanthomonadales bacterium]|nr:phosphotransferase family protein [Xanthomonadales bacterium]
MDNTIQHLDDATLTKYLADRLPGFKGPLQSKKFAGGQSNPTYLLTSPSGQYVLRRKPPGQLLASAHAVDREFRVLKALENSVVPVARPLLLCTDDSVTGSMFYLMDFVAGRILWDPALPDSSQQQRGEIFYEMLRVLAAIHDVDLGAAGLEDFGHPGDYFERQTGRWSKQYRAAETESIAAMEHLMDWLPANMPANDGQISLIHGDYRLDNLIFHPQQTRVLAVLDWELSTLGHPLADLAYFCMCLRLPRTERIKGLAGMNLAELGIPDEQALVDRYCELRGLTGISQWNFYLAFSMFRLAAICQGVMKRALDGNAANDNAVATGRMARPLAELGASLAI